MSVRVQQSRQALVKFLTHKLIKYTTIRITATINTNTTINNNVILSHYKPLHFGVIFMQKYPEQSVRIN